jgi:hypothetical protein
MTIKRWQTLLIGLVFSAVFLFLALRTASLPAILNAFRTARYGFVALAAVLVVLTVVARGVRWSALTQGRLSVADAFWLFNIGFLFNNVLPARLGEFARALLTGRRPGMHFTSALSSIVVERLFDMVSVVVLLGLVLLTLPLPGWATGAGALMGAASLAGIIVLAVAARIPDQALRVGSRLLSLVPRISRDRAHEFLKPFVDGLGAVSDVRTFVLGLALSIGAWLFSGLAVWVLMLAFWDSVPLMVGQLVVAAAGLGVAVPAAPSGVGPYEAAIIGVLTVIDYDADISRGFAFGLHILNFAITSLLGVLGLMREGISFGQVARQAEALRAHAVDEPEIDQGFVPAPPGTHVAPPQVADED